MCKGSIQLDTIKKVGKNKAKEPACSLFYRIPDEKHFFLKLFMLTSRLLDAMFARVFRNSIVSFL